MSAPILRSVDDPTSHDPAPTATGGLPIFEGLTPDFARIRLSGAGDLETGPDEASHLDDTVRLFIEGRVVRVDHVVEKKTGFLKRVHTVEVLEAVRLPWDFDTGALDG